MQKWICSLTILLCTHNILESQLCIEGRFSEANYFSSDEIVIENNTSYGLADNWYYDVPAPSLNSFNIAYPSFSEDPLTKRPLVVLAHGGAFWGGEKENLDYIIQQLAMRGFVAVTLNYRKGWDAFGDPENCEGDGASMQVAIYKAMQDVQAGMRYLTYHAADYGIDTSWIFIGGQSAGVYAMMNSLYMSQEEWNTIYSEQEALYGGIFSSTNNIDIDYSVKGFLNLWGGVMDTAFISIEEVVPTISFYGTDDDVVPPYSGNFLGCEQYAYVYGSAAINEFMNDHGVCSVLNKRAGYGHDTYEDDYVIDNMSCFMKSIFCNDCSSYEVNYDLSTCSDIVIDETSVLGNEKLALEIFPNPASDYVVINSINALNKNSAISIYDVMGKRMNVVYQIQNFAMILNTENLAEGAYFFLLENEQQIAKGSFIIQ